MLTYPKSRKRVRRIPMHLSSGHVTLMPGKFSPLFTLPPFNFPQSDLGRRADSRWALPQISSFFSRRVISELRRPIGAKFCTMLGAAFSFIIPVKNFGGASQKNFYGQKHAKFDPISVDFKVRRRISPEGMNIFKIGKLLVRQRFFPR